MEAGITAPGSPGSRPPDCSTPGGDYKLLREPTLRYHSPVIFRNSPPGLSDSPVLMKAGITGPSSPQSGPLDCSPGGDFEQLRRSRLRYSALRPICTSIDMKAQQSIKLTLLLALSRNSLPGLSYSPVLIKDGITGPGSPESGPLDGFTPGGDDDKGRRWDKSYISNFFIKVYTRANCQLGNRVFANVVLPITAT